MARKAYSLINSLILLFISAVLLLSAIFLMIQINTYKVRYNKESIILQNRYTESQKELIKREVLWVGDYIYENLRLLDDDSNVDLQGIEADRAALSERLLENISRIRFDGDGYIYVNSMDGDALVSNGNLVLNNRKLWEVFSSNPDSTRDLFTKQYNAAREKGGAYIYYSMEKPDDPQSEFPKISYILGIPELNWLIGSGLYLDDVSLEIDQLRNIAREELHSDIGSTIIVTLSVICLFVFFFFLLGRRLHREFGYFTTFFEAPVTAYPKLEDDKFHCRELALLARQAGRMQEDKIEALERLKESESWFRLLAENSRDMIFKMSFPEGTFLYVSPAAYDILGYTVKEIMDEPYHIRNTIHPDWREWLEDVFSQINSGYIAPTFEFPVINKLGEERWISQKNTLLKGEKEGSHYLIGRLSDETRRKKVEEELNRAYRMEAIGKLAGGVAHDFNNVLAGIMNAANVLKSPRRQIDEKGRNMADLILKAASRAADLTAKLTAFGGKRTLFLKPQNVHHILEETEVILRRTIDQQIAIKMNLQADNSIIRADGTEIQSIILNLGINASHAIERTGNIFINTENIYLDEAYCAESPFPCHMGDYLRIEVLDTGKGMDEHTLKHIFEPFFTTKEKGKGSGLGLATVYRAVLDHKGLIQVTSEVDEGTSFIILFPCIDEKPAEESLPSDTADGKTGTILLVDDEAFIRETGVSILEEAGYKVITASNGKEGLHIFEENCHKIDLVILDVIMPEMSGIDAYNGIRKMRDDCPVIMISGYSPDEDLDKLMEEGVFKIMRKPFDQSLMKKEIDLALYGKKGKACK